MKCMAESKICSKCGKYMPTTATDKRDCQKCEDRRLAILLPMWGTDGD
jgi:ribosomal protein L40E